MAHHKTTPKANIITVRDANNTYTASWDGEKASSTAGPEQAAKRLAFKLLGHDLDLEPLERSATGQHRFRVCIDA